ncbi:MAG: hypothetical protein ACJAR9_000651 [Celeribacter sp.]|jgi:hypothetical protein
MGDNFGVLIEFTALIANRSIIVLPLIMLIRHLYECCAQVLGLPNRARCRPWGIRVLRTEHLRVSGNDVTFHAQYIWASENVRFSRRIRDGSRD